MRCLGLASRYKNGVHQCVQDRGNASIFKSLNLQNCMQIYINGTGVEKHPRLGENVASLRETYGKDCVFRPHLFLGAVLTAAYKIDSVQLQFLWAIKQ